MPDLVLAGDLVLGLLVVLGMAAVLMRDLLAAVGVLGAYSLVIAILWCWMNAVDVAFTEAAVGAGISTVLMLAAVARVGRHERREHPRRAAATPPRVREVLALFAMAAAAAALLYGARDMPRVGDAQAPANRNPDVAQYYLEHGPEEGGRAENVVTSVLADYRGYDTLGETTVIFTAALCVVLLLRLSVSRRDIARSEEDDERTSPGEEPS